MNKYNISKSPFIDIKGSLKVHHEDVKGLEGDLAIVRRKYYQANDYVKHIVTDNIDLSIYFNLTPTAKNLLHLIITLLEYNNPAFRLKAQDAGVVLNCDISTIHKSIRELIKAKYIAKTNTREVYWINHNRYFKGNYTFELYAQNKIKNEK
jgi:hypothetical protein